MKIEVPTKRNWFAGKVNHCATVDTKLYFFPVKMQFPVEQKCTT